MKPLVSVLVLAYNHGDYLADTLDSILKQQTTFPFEVLIGEDHSTDDTLAVATTYADEHPQTIRLVTDARNVGMHENLHRLIRASEGEYIALCEGDDYWNPCDKLQEQLGYLEARPGTGAVHGDFDHIAIVHGQWRALRRHWRHHAVRVPEGSVFPDLIRRNFIQTCTLMVRGSLARAFLDSPFAGRYRVGDWPLCLFISLRAEIGYIDRSLATYRKVAGSATNRGLRAEIDRARDHLRMASDFCVEAGADDKLERDAHVQAMQVVLDRSVRAREMAEVRATLAWLEERGAESRGWRAKTKRLLMRNTVGVEILGRYSQHRASSLEHYRAAPVSAGECP